MFIKKIFLFNYKNSHIFKMQNKYIKFKIELKDY